MDREENPEKILKNLLNFNLVLYELFRVLVRYLAGGAGSRRGKR